MRASESSGRGRSRSGYAIATPHHLSTEAGIRAHDLGGNAIDAALAAAVSLTVTLPDNCGIGGDLIALVREPDGETAVVNATGWAARGVVADDLRAAGSAMPSHGPSTVTVPGAVAGWHELAQGGRLGWSEVFQEAIGQAREGVPASRSVAEALVRCGQRLSQDRGMRALFFADGHPLQRGDALVQKRAATTLEQLASDGPSAFYDGKIGASWLETMREAGSPLDADDLRHFQCERATPLRSKLGPHEIVTAPPNSQGMLLPLTLRLIEREDPDPDPLGHRADVIARAFNAAAIARGRYLADPRFSEVPVDPDPTGLGSAAPGEGVTSHNRGDTVAVVAMDSEGRCVSLIQSLFDSFGAGMLDQRTGIIAHNRGCFFSLDPESPNVLAPRKRPAHTLAPLIVEKSGDVWAVLGTMGGLVQTQILTQIFLSLRRGASAPEAIDAPRWIVGAIDSDRERAAIQAESRVPNVATAALAAAGWSVTGLSDYADDVGEAQVIVSSVGGAFEATSDPRGEGSAASRWEP